MDQQTMWLVIAAVVIVAVLAVAWVYAQGQRRVRLRTHFGPEYDRAVREAGSPTKADALLTERAKRGTSALRPTGELLATRSASLVRRASARAADRVPRTRRVPEQVFGAPQ